MLNTTYGLRLCRRVRCGTRIIGLSGHARSLVSGRNALASDTVIRFVSCRLDQRIRRSARPRRWEYSRRGKKYFTRRREDYAKAQRKPLRLRVNFAPLRENSLWPPLP